MFIWRCEESDRKDDRFVSAGITSGEASAKSRKIYALASLGIARSSMRPMRNAGKSTSTVTHRSINHPARCRQCRRAGLPILHSDEGPKSRAGLGPGMSLTERRAAERLMVLESMGLAESRGPKNWRVRRDFENVLRAMQRSADHQKTLAAHGALMSDERLPLAVVDFRQLTTLEGRILVHGEEEVLGTQLPMLEGTDARVHYVTKRQKWKRHGIAVGCERIRSFGFASCFPMVGRLLQIHELGDAESILRNRAPPSRDRPTSYPAWHCSSRRRLGWMAWSVSEGACGGCCHAGTPTSGERSRAQRDPRPRPLNQWRVFPSSRIHNSQAERGWSRSLNKLPVCR